MEPLILQELRARAPAIHVRWQALLHVEGSRSALTNPDVSGRLVPDALAKILSTLAKPSRHRFSLVAETAHRLPPCDCGNNPFRALYIAGEQAFVEAIVLVQAGLPAQHRSESDVAEVVRAVRHLALDEIDTFCGVCAHRGSAPNCRHAAVR